MQEIPGIPYNPLTPGAAPPASGSGQIISQPAQTKPWSVLSIAKFLTALAGVAGEAVTAGLVSGTALRWTEIGIGVATAVAVWLVPNKQ
jgi:hypothetical protein